MAGLAAAITVARARFRGLWALCVARGWAQPAWFCMRSAMQPAVGRWVLAVAHGPAAFAPLVTSCWPSFFFGFSCFFFGVPCLFSTPTLPSHFLCACALLRLPPLPPAACLSSLGAPPTLTPCVWSWISHAGQDLLQVSGPWGCVSVFGWCTRSARLYR